MIAAPVPVVAGQVLVEAGRKRTLAVLVLFGCAIIVSTAFLSFFQLRTEVKFFKDVAMTVIFLFGMVATLVLTSAQLSGEIESRTIYNVLSRPIRRWELVVGKFLGAITAVALSVAPMTGILMFFIITDRGGSVLDALKAAYLLWLAFSVLAAIALGIGSFATSIACVSLTVLAWVVSYLKAAVTTYLALATHSGIAVYAGQAFYYLLPNFENFNTRTAVVHNVFLPWAYVVRSTFYAFGLAVLFLYIGTQIFEEREV